MSGPPRGALGRILDRFSRNDDDASLVDSLDEIAAQSGGAALDVALSSLMQLTGAERGFIAVPEGVGLRCEAARAFGSLDLEQPEAQLSRSILHAAMQDAGVHVQDAGQDERFAEQASVQALGLKAVIAVPLVIAGEPFAVLYLDNPQQGASFGDAERHAVERFAELVAPMVARDLELQRLRRGADARIADLRGSFEFGALLGQSEALGSVMELVSKVAPTQATVLVRGETGTGKELVAGAIHANSNRATGPLVTLNCGALPTELVESELFGHERGAFTSADARRVGRFEMADGGTLFLDEVGELPAAAQAKLLRVLETGSFERVGSSETQSVNVRVVAATHRDLQADVATGRFREDLAYRIRVFEIELPPLRDRSGDVLVLAEHFVGQLAARHGSRATGFTPRAGLALAHYGWPGNVRELRNVVERAVILATGPQIDLELLPAEFSASLGGNAGPGAEAPGLKAAVAEFKRRFVQQARAAAQGDHARTAELLGVNPKYLYKLLRDLDLS